MKVWEKPVLSVLGISKTRGSALKMLSGVPSFSNDLDFVAPEDFVVSVDCGGSSNPSNPSGGSYSYSDSDN